MTAHPRDDGPDGPSEAPDAVGRTSGSGLGRGKRVAATAVGGSLLVLGLRRRSLAGAAATLAGGWLVYRGVSGRGGLRRAPGGDAASDEERPETGAAEVERTVTIGASADELHRFWREPRNLSRIVGHFAEVTTDGEDRQRWTVRGPFGRSVSWDARIVEDRPGELLRWESTDGAAVPNEGAVRFRSAPGDRGTEVTLRLRFDPPGGALGDAAVKLSGGAPAVLASEALWRFKSLVETGEIPTLEGNSSARGSGDLL